MKRIVVMLVVGFTLTVSGLALALSGGFDLSWFSIDGGGGVSNAGGYALSGTIGQADAGASSGARYKLAGGFWPDSIPRNLGMQNVYLPVVMR